MISVCSNFDDIKANWNWICASVSRKRHIEIVVSISNTLITDLTLWIATIFFFFCLALLRLVWFGSSSDLFISKPYDEPVSKMGIDASKWNEIRAMWKMRCCLTFRIVLRRGDLKFIWTYNRVPNYPIFLFFLTSNREILMHF